MAKFKIDINANKHFTGELSPVFSVAEARKASQFHKGLQGYEPTPLRDLSSLAEMMGVKGILVKDESYRFGLNAFKMLGGVYAIARLLCEEFGWGIEQFDFDKLKNEVDEKMTFATTTDGNHGRGVAWAAEQLGQNAIVYMPKGAAEQRVKNIRSHGAECIVTDMNYDDTVRMVAEKAQQNDWKIVQDTAWEGYTDIPTWIMQGYSTMAVEAIEQIAEQGLPKPTHVVLQAGVGAMAAGVLGYLAEELGASDLKAIIVEPDQADCIYRSGSSEKGEMINVGGDMATIAVGLACGEPNPLSWDVLRNCSSHFVSVEDKVPALGMRVLGNPLAGDERIVSGESGAIGTGLLAAVHFSDNKAELMQSLNLNEDSVVLLLSTEGETDPVNYRDVVWQGKYSSI
ncbi:diaminopropionate ammonia-lyase [Reinekea marinisedimentorum]|uniref:Diaminopropionate ammonia-lyase n=1 Tax=Reinekea marinisedimentorum TaxID=230495 RepID=A0A4R3I8G5_9GAMM|nr:diaminopropionate ammonia-lyase [Reinekea marinisedimentorum]TCS41276.1 diaminopropionate ammonia-lyase [Reinekea marinisedimentorum]